MFVKDDKERAIFEKIFGYELMSAQELSEGLSLLWDSKDADEGFGDIFEIGWQNLLLGFASFFYYLKSQTNFYVAKKFG